ncbi:hypothetical protein MVEN_00983300 [Mycena venus]|uniref:Uncharacterized protein n=1 Tax=Mycena venus TaxID=2733690 RepID=A0A8H7D2C5_9AGAR|nr:hypothetical protein MVEN_00983300 [Mycena venus]
MMSSSEDPEDILSSALTTLYDYQPITLSSGPNSLFVYDPPEAGTSKITLRTPDTLAANWSLHASSVWVASRFLADNVDYLNLPAHLIIAKRYPAVSIVVSDYNDVELIRTLSENVAENGVSANCRVVAYGWGSDPSELFLPDTELFDVVIAADTLWNPEFHGLFIEALKLTLKRSPQSRIHLFAGLHTGRYTIQSFLSAVSTAGFELEIASERETNGVRERLWSVDRAEGEDESERRRWIVYMCLRWR